MKIKIIFITITLAVIVWGSIYGILQVIKGNNTDESSGEYVFPDGTSGTVTPVDMSSPYLEIVGNDGDTVRVRDVRALRETDGIGSGNYVVGGVDAGGIKPYELLYFESDGSYLIALEEEPLRDAREAGERELLQTLEISEKDACNLQIRVSTSLHVSQTYGAKELGLSFCPGSIELP